MIYGYARVSAKTQLKGNSLDEQRVELKRNGCEVIVEEQFTGKTTSRPKFEELTKHQLQHGDTLIVTKLDRFARNVTEGISTIRYLFDKGVKVHVLNVGLLENTAMGNFFITTLLAVEKDITVISKKDAEELGVDRITIGETKTNGSVRKIPLSKRTIEALTAFKQESEKYLEKHKYINQENMLFFQRRNVENNQVISAYGDGMRTRLRKISNYLLLEKSVCPYSLRKLGDTERKNSAKIPPRVSDYIMGHNGNPLDLRYVSDYYPLAKEAMPAWEKILDKIIGSETK